MNTREQLAILILVICSFITGCATRELSDESRQEISAIFVVQEVFTPKEPSFHGTADSLMLSGLIGGVIDQISGNRVDLIAKYMDENDIVIGDIAREGVLNVLRKNPKVSDKKIVDNRQEADTFLEIGIITYGLGEVGGFTGLYKSQLGIRAELADSSGNTLWVAASSATINTESIPEYPLDDYFNSPQLMRESFTRAAQTVGMMLSDKL